MHLLTFSYLVIALFCDPGVRVTISLERAHEVIFTVYHFESCCIVSTIEQRYTTAGLSQSDRG